LNERPECQTGMPVQHSGRSTSSAFWRSALRSLPVRYDTVDQRALKSLWDGQLNLAHDPETKKNRKNIKNRVAQKKTVQGLQAKVREGSPGGRSETSGGRICERGRF